MSFSDLVSRHIGLAMRKQLALADHLGEHNWQLDLNRGIVDFGKSSLFSKRRVYPVQLVGTESELSGTWLWSWANEQSSIPSAVLRASNTLRSHGNETGVTELTEPELSSDSYPGHLLASVASGICNADCYYRGPYEGGAVFFLISDTPLSVTSPTPVPRIITVLTTVISEYDVDHRSMVTAYLRAEGLRLTQTPAEISASGQDGRAIRVLFDELGRISNVQAKVA